MQLDLAKIRERFARSRVRRIAAVDFDSRQLRIVIARRGARAMRVTRLCAFDLPAGLDVSNPAAVGSFLKDSLVAAGGCDGLLMNVPRGQAVLKTLTLPASVQSFELPSMVQYQVEKELPFRLEEAVIDFAQESHHGSSSANADSLGAPAGRQVLVAAVRVPLVDYYRQVAAAAGTRLLALGLRPCATHCALKAFGGVAEEAAVAVIHVTADETEINVLTGSSLAFSRSAVVKLPSPAGSAEEKRDALAALVSEISRSLHNYRAFPGAKLISRIGLAGGTGLEQELAKELTRRLGIDGELLNLPGLHGLEQPIHRSAFISAVGLAANGIDQPMPFDFVNPKRPLPPRDTRKNKMMALAGGAIVVALAVTVACAAYVSGKEQRVRQLEQDFKKLKAEADQVRELGKRVAVIESWETESRPWLNHWAFLSGIFPSCADVYITSLNTIQSDNSLGFSVQARRDHIITELSKKLADAGYDARPGKVSTSSDSHGYIWNTEIRMRIPSSMKLNLKDVQPLPRPADDSPPGAIPSGPPRATTFPSATTQPSPPAVTPPSGGPRNFKRSTTNPSRRWRSRSS